MGYSVPPPYPPKLLHAILILLTFLITKNVVHCSNDELMLTYHLRNDAPNLELELGQSGIWIVPYTLSLDRFDDINQSVLPVDSIISFHLIFNSSSSIHGVIFDNLPIHKFITVSPFYNESGEHFEVRYEIRSLSKLATDINDAGVGVGIYEMNVTCDAIDVINGDSVDFNVSLDLTDSMLTVNLVHSLKIRYLSIMFGYTYLLLWSISFYPQIHENYRRKSVVGLNFDFISLNGVGFLLYTVFNLAFIASPSVYEEYVNRYGYEHVNPVHLNDLLFSGHAFLACLLTISQCFFYERSDQKVSTPCRTFHVITFLVISITFVVVISEGDAISFKMLDWLYLCSYFKLAITLIKYGPQVFMNYRRRSTVGWSIGNVLLDLSGGAFSVGQMSLDAYNSDDWYVTTVGDPTKLGLGLFSISFDLVFILQHYVWFRSSSIVTNSQTVHVVVVDESEVMNNTSGGSAVSTDEKQPLLNDSEDVSSDSIKQKSSNCEI